MIDRATDPDANVFVVACSKCGAVAEKLAVEMLEGDGYLWQRNFLGSSHIPLESSMVGPVRDAIACNDVDRLFVLRSSLTQSYCPSCEAAYCGDCWNWGRSMSVKCDQETEEWPDTNEASGDCPDGHERYF